MKKDFLSQDCAQLSTIGIPMTPDGESGSFTLSTDVYLIAS